MDEFSDQIVTDTKDEDFDIISVIGHESNILFSAIYKETKEKVIIFKCPQLSKEYAFKIINIYSEIKCNHIVPIFKYYFHPNVTFITKFPIKGKLLTDILSKISEKNKLTIILQIIDTIRIFQSYNIYSVFFDIDSIYVDEQNDFHIKFCSIFPIYVADESFSNFKMNAILIFQIMKTILGIEKASYYFDRSNFYQSASKILYYLIQQISKNNSTLNVNISQYENYFKDLIEIAENQKEQTKSGNENLEAQYLCVISGINEKKYLLNLTQKNHPKGQFLYGYRVLNGIGNRKDQIHGAKYIKSAADLSNPEAQFYYSILLKKGNGVRQNLNQSKNYLKFSSDNKYKEALVLYGHSISSTMPVIAINCYKEAAQRGSIEGFFYYIFSVYKNSNLQSGNKNNSCSSIMNFNITFCSNIPIFKNSYKNFLNSIPLNYLKLMAENDDEDSYSQFLLGFFYKQIDSIFLNPTSNTLFDVKDIYYFENNDDSNDNKYEEKEEFYLRKSMEKGNLYSTYLYAKILLKKGQIQYIYKYLKDAKDSEYKNLKYYYAKCLQETPNSDKEYIKEMINEAAKGECYEAIYEEGEELFETDSNSSWSKIYLAAKSGIDTACLKYGKYIIKSNVNKGKYFLKLCAYKIPEAKYILSSYSDNIEDQMKQLKKAADEGFSKASYLYGYSKYNEGDIETAVKYFKKSSDPSSFLYLAHCFFLQNLKMTKSSKDQCSHYIKLAIDSNITQAYLPYGICLYYGIGMNKNQEESANYFRQCFNLLNFIGIYNYAICMEKGIGIKKMNQNDVYSFLINQKNNAEKNKKNDDDDENNKDSSPTVLFNSSSDYSLSYIYLYIGYLVYLKGDIKEAKRYFKIAASKGNMMAAILFARCIEMTSFSQQKLLTALKIYHLVVQNLSSPAFKSYSNACELRRKAELCEELLKKKLNYIRNLQQLKKIADEGDDQAQYFYGAFCMGVDDFFSKQNNKIHPINESINLSNKNKTESNNNENKVQSFGTNNNKSTTTKNAQNNNNKNENFSFKFNTNNSNDKTTESTSSSNKNNSPSIWSGSIKTINKDKKGWSVNFASYKSDSNNNASSTNSNFNNSFSNRKNYFKSTSNANESINRPFNFTSTKNTTNNTSISKITPFDFRKKSSVTEKSFDNDTQTHSSSSSEPKESNEKKLNSSLFQDSSLLIMEIPSKAEGIHYLEESASSGNDKAEELLARYLIKGDGIKQDISRAVSLLVSASNKGNAQAKNNLGVLYKRGVFINKDEKAAFELFKEAANEGNSFGLLHYAMCLMKGRGVELNQSLALTSLRKARELGVPRASYILGLYYLNSDPKGETEGMKLIREAANLGYKKAKIIIEL